ncbi:DUF6777 domain-containing protein [Streptomyces sp. NBC_01233]|uniref:DUF6777 domain-containing protein n=1 Tax=Streptomyces sp. NBC_01233 TaxID=2903787 RepID=UPI002E11CA64|nr:hypothetical protein OG332_39540 [Streptomyces sp. NBC_01233]
MPRLATMLVAVVAVVALAVVLTRPSGTDNAGGEVFLQPAAASGPDPFTESTVTNEAKPPESPAASPTGPKTPSAPTSATQGTTTGTRSISGSAPGVYGGTRDTASCDVEKQIKALSADPSKNAAFASALGIQPQSVPAYLRSLTSVQLRMDTRVTNHGYQNGKLTSYQAVLQAGTAVLVDDRGVPRVRCACGNPLGPPVALKANPKRFGQTWPSYQPQKVVVIAPAPTVVHKIVIYDQDNRRWYEREKGSHQGRPDRPVPPPVIQTPTFIPTKPTPTGTETKPKPTGTHPKPTETETKPVKPTETETEPVKPTETETEPVKPTETETEPVKPTETETEPVKPTETETEPVKPTETETEPVKPTETETEPAKPTETQTEPKTLTETETPTTPTEKEPTATAETRTTATAETETRPDTVPEQPESVAPVEPEAPVPPEEEEPEVNES